MNRIIPASLVSFLMLGLIIWIGPKPGPADPEVENIVKGPVVLELFTSQGCSSCPPADALLKEIQKTAPPHVFTLAYHVDYWNYIGWTDPFSNPDYTELQSAYNRKLNSRSNYTPQMVVNGKEHFVGSDASKAKQAISRYGRDTMENQVLVRSMDQKGRKLKIGYDVAGSILDKDLRVVLLLKQRQTLVRRGENRDRKLVNTNIVVAQKVQNIQDSQGIIDLEIPELVQPDEELRIVILVQNKELEIHGAGMRQWTYRSSDQ